MSALSCPAGGDRHPEAALGSLSFTLSDPTEHGEGSTLIRRGPVVEPRCGDKVGKDERRPGSNGSVAVSKFRTLTRALTPCLGVSGATSVYLSLSFDSSSRLLRCQQRRATINTLLDEVFTGRKNMLDAIHLSHLSPSTTAR